MPETEALVTWEELPFVVADRYMVSVIHTCKSGAGAAFTIVAGVSLFTVTDTLTSTASLFFKSWSPTVSQGSSSIIFYPTKDSCMMLTLGILYYKGAA